VQIAGRSRNKAVAEVVQHVALADFVFRSTDLLKIDALPDNIGFSIGDITIFESQFSHGYHFKDLIPGQVFLLLNRFSYRQNFDNYCLAACFTNRNFGQL